MHHNKLGVKRKEKVFPVSRPTQFLSEMKPETNYFFTHTL